VDVRADDPAIADAEHEGVDAGAGGGAGSDQGQPGAAELGQAGALGAAEARGGDAGGDQGAVVLPEQLEPVLVDARRVRVGDVQRRDVARVAGADQEQGADGGLLGAAPIEAALHVGDAEDAADVDRGPVAGGAGRIHLRAHPWQDDRPHLLSGAVGAIAAAGAQLGHGAERVEHAIARPDVGQGRAPPRIGEGHRAERLGLDHRDGAPVDAAQLRADAAGHQIEGAVAGQRGRGHEAQAPARGEADVDVALRPRADERRGVPAAGAALPSGIARERVGSAIVNLDAAQGLELTKMPGYEWVTIHRGLREGVAHGAWVPRHLPVKGADVIGP
jgi:hypothetical protein